MKMITWLSLGHHSLPSMEAPHPCLHQSPNRIKSLRRSFLKLLRIDRFFRTISMKLRNLQLNHARIGQQMEQSQCDKKEGCHRPQLQSHLNLSLKLSLRTNLKIKPILKLPSILKVLHPVPSILIHQIAHRQLLHNDLSPPANLEGNTQITPGPQAISNRMGS